MLVIDTNSAYWLSCRGLSEFIAKIFLSSEFFGCLEKHSWGTSRIHIVLFVKLSDTSKLSMALHSTIFVRVLNANQLYSP